MYQTEDVRYKLVHCNHHHLPSRQNSIFTFLSTCYLVSDRLWRREMKWEQLILFTVGLDLSCQCRSVPLHTVFGKTKQKKQSTRDQPGCVAIALRVQWQRQNGKTSSANTVSLWQKPLRQWQIYFWGCFWTPWWKMQLCWIVTFTWA